MFQEKLFKSKDLPNSAYEVGQFNFSLVSHSKDLVGSGDRMEAASHAIGQQILQVRTGQEVFLD